VGRQVLIHVDDVWIGPECLSASAEKTVWRPGIPLALILKSIVWPFGIDGPVKRIPATFDLDVGFVDEPASLYLHLRHGPSTSHLIDAVTLLLHHPIAGGRSTKRSARHQKQKIRARVLFEDSRPMFCNSAIPTILLNSCNKLCLPIISETAGKSNGLYYERTN
jgi:hypothetical protein